MLFKQEFIEQHNPSNSWHNLTFYQHEGTYCTAGWRAGKHLLHTLFIKDLSVYKKEKEKVRKDNLPDIWACVAAVHSEILQVLGKLITALSAITSTGKLHILVPHIYHNHIRLLFLAAFSPGAKTIGARFISLAGSSAATARERNRGRQRKKYREEEKHPQGVEKWKAEPRKGERKGGFMPLIGIILWLFFHQNHQETKDNIWL